MTTLINNAVTTAASPVDDQSSQPATAEGFNPFAGLLPRDETEVPTAPDRTAANDDAGGDGEDEDDFADLRSVAALMDDVALAKGSANRRLAVLTGRRMAMARELNGLSQMLAAELLGYANSSQLSLWEQGRRKPPLAHLVRAAQVYGTTTDWLLGLSDDPEREKTLALKAAALRGVRTMLSTVVQSTVEAVERHATLLGPDATNVADLVAAGDALANAAVTLMRLNVNTFDELHGGARLQRCVAEFETVAITTRQRLATFHALDRELHTQLAAGK